MAPAMLCTAADKRILTGSTQYALRQKNINAIPISTLDVIARPVKQAAAISFLVISTEGQPKAAHSGEICSRMEVNYRPQPDASAQFTRSGAEWARHDKKRLSFR
jgi:hypothetical protein